MHCPDGRVQPAAQLAENEAIHTRRRTVKEKKKENKIFFFFNSCDVSFRVLDQSIVADSRRFIATLQSLNVSDSAKSTLERVSSKLDDSYIYLDSANVVIECILANGGLNTVVEYPSKLADLSAQLSLAPKQLESVLDKMRPYLQFRIDETAVMLDQSGPHALIKHPRLRLFWKRAIGVEAIDGVDFLNKIANYTKQTYDGTKYIRTT